MIIRLDPAQLQGGGETVTVSLIARDLDLAPTMPRGASAIAAVLSSEILPRCVTKSPRSMIVAPPASDISAPDRPTRTAAISPPMRIPTNSPTHSDMMSPGYSGIMSPTVPG